uniref:Uncharacterized protein n=1 Tax=Cacopsylla melanoneura TaxID=428564 RepID=A0A8D8XYZ0_9HEMI
MLIVAQRTLACCLYCTRSSQFHDCYFSICLIHSNLLTLGKLLVKELPGFIEAMPDHAMKKGSRDASDVTYERKLFGELYNLMLFRVILCPHCLIDFDQTWYKCS